MNKDILNILNNPFISGIFAVLVTSLLIFGGTTLLDFNNPTTTYEKQITISERQILNSVLTRSYYVITPDNIWYECNEYNNTWDRLQPGHTYNILIRTASNTSWLRNPQIGMNTNFYNYDMIVGIDGEVK